jgi:hypothetical protein
MCHGKISERKLMDSLCESLAGALPKTALIKREYQHNGAPRDAFVKLPDLDGIFIEAKFDLRKTGRYNELIGQVTGLSGSKVIILLFGRTRRDLLALIHHTFAKQIETGDLTVVEKDVSEEIINRIRASFVKQSTMLAGIARDRDLAKQLALKLQEYREAECHAARAEANRRG